MKSILLTSKTSMAVILFASITVLSSCKKEGCTDPLATNYSTEAKKDDSSCQYEGSVVFWNDQATANSAVAAGVTSFKYYIDGTLVGSQGADIYFNGTDPSCGEQGLVTYNENLGSFKTQAVTYSVTDQNGTQLWGTTINLNANTCLKQQLVW